MQQGEKRKMTADKVRAKLKRITSGDISQRELARQIGCSPAFLNDIILGKREPAGKVLTWLGLRRKVTYVAPSFARSRQTDGS